MQPFIDFAPDLPEAEISWGVTWLDRNVTWDPDRTNPIVESDEVVQSLFFVLEIKNLNFLGFQIQSIMVEFQYFDELEFKRRDKFEDNW